jgi:TPR repeat protein
MYSLGQGVPNNWNFNNSTAVFWYRKAAEQGSADGQYQVGYMYSRGMIQNKNQADSVDFFLQAAEQGHHDAMAELGRMYAQGRPGVQCNAEKAEMWHLKLSESGDSRSVLTPIGDMYADGTCGQRDEQKAVEWYRKGAAREEHSGQYCIFQWPIRSSKRR